MNPVACVERSENVKMGDCSATYVSQASCPSSCPLYGAGCYAELGYAGLTTARLNGSAVKRADDLARLEAAAIDGLSGRRPLRLHVVGDCRTNNAARIVGEASRRYKEKHGSKVWSYTHAWRVVDRGSWGDAVSVLASCEKLSDIPTAMSRGYAAAIVVDKFQRQGL